MSILFQEENFRITPLQEEVSTRRYFLAEKEGEEPIVLCKDQSINWDFVNLSDYLSKQGILVPKVLSVDEERSVLFQEYSGAYDLSTLNEDEFNIHLKQAIDLIHKLQTLDPPDFVKERRFDYAKLSFEMNLTIDSYNKWKENASLNSELSEEILFFLDQTCKLLDQYPCSVFTHRDFHSRNLIWDDRKKRMSLIDFQDARMGTPFYDLSSILYDAYRPISLQNRIDLLEYFNSTSTKPFKNFLGIYYLQAFQRSFKALGTYIIQVNEKQNWKFLPSLKNSLSNLIEISQLGVFPDEVYIFSEQLLQEVRNY